ncbi:MAG: cysteine desulfurase [Ruminococcaceae bacterium]|nr:cysteine desulfurase [Oscillospiraceae bacterium]
MEIYLDNSATTAISAAARAKMLEAADNYGNPSSLHDMGMRAEKLISEARRSILTALGAKGSGEIVFTSCGTEASSLAIFGSAFAKERRDANLILTTNSEHPSVENAMRRLEKEGFEVVRISTRGGVLDLEQISSLLNKKIFMASFMMVNNETGALYNVAEAFAMIKAKYPSAITHCDAVQGFLKTRFTPARIHADLVTISGHKLHAPKGVGALYISNEMIKAKKIVPFLLGGGQENGWRSGTENVIGIAAFGAAVADIYPRLDATLSHMLGLRSYAIEKLQELDVTLNIPNRTFAPHILNITLPNIKSETMLHFLSRDGIYVSSGSACSSHSHSPSSSLIAFGLDAHKADCSLRISFSEYNQKSDVDALSEALAKGIETLVRIKR